MTFPAQKPLWLTFDCYGTLIQWDEGLLTTIAEIFSRRGAAHVDALAVIATYDGYEHALEAETPHRSFREVATEALRRTMRDLGLPFDESEADHLAAAISAMPPFPEVPEALARLKRQGFWLCVISNTDDDIIAGNVAQLDGHIDRVVTAEQAGAYKPARRIFEHAHGALGVGTNDIIHICASPHLDLAAARDFGFPAIWIDRGTGRRPLPDYTPDRTFPTLDRVPAFFESIGWG